jgi:hypothetical protein
LSRQKGPTEERAGCKRLYDAIENSVADLSDPMLKDRIAELKSIRDQARADAEWAEDAIERLGPSITSQALKNLASGCNRRAKDAEMLVSTKWSLRLHGVCAACKYRRRDLRSSLYRNRPFANQSQWM